MTIQEARTKALHDKSLSARGSEIMQAFFYIANSADLRRLADVLEVEEKAQALKRKGK